MTLNTYIWLTRISICLMLLFLATLLVFIVLGSMGVAPSFAMPLAASQASVLTNSILTLGLALLLSGVCVVNELGISLFGKWEKHKEPKKKVGFTPTMKLFEDVDKRLDELLRVG